MVKTVVTTVGNSRKAVGTACGNNRFSVVTTGDNNREACFTTGGNKRFSVVTMRGNNRFCEGPGMCVAFPFYRYCALVALVAISFKVLGWTLTVPSQSAPAVATVASGSTASAVPAPAPTPRSHRWPADLVYRVLAGMEQPEHPYTLGPRLGSGSFGKVFAATRSGTATALAVKVITGAQQSLGSNSALVRSVARPVPPRLIEVLRRCLPDFLLNSFGSRVPYAGVFWVCCRPVSPAMLP